MENVRKFKRLTLMLGEIGFVKNTRSKPID